MEFEPVRIERSGEARSESGRSLHAGHSGRHAGGSVLEHLLLEAVRDLALAQFAQLAFALLAFQLHFEAFARAGAVHAGQLIVQHRVHSRRAQAQTARHLAAHATRREARVRTRVFAATTTTTKSVHTS